MMPIVGGKNVFALRVLQIDVGGQRPEHALDFVERRRVLRADYVGKAPEQELSAAGRREDVGCAHVEAGKIFFSGRPGQRADDRDGGLQYVLADRVEEGEVGLFRHVQIEENGGNRFPLLLQYLQPFLLVGGAEKLVFRRQQFEEPGGGRKLGQNNQESFFLRHETLLCEYNVFYQL